METKLGLSAANEGKVNKVDRTAIIAQIRSKIIPRLSEKE